MTIKINGMFTIKQLRTLRDTKIAWNGPPDVAYETELARMCEEGIYGLEAAQDFDVAEIENGKVIGLVKL